MDVIGKLAALDVAILELEQALGRLESVTDHATAALVRQALSSARRSRGWLPRAASQRESLSSMIADVLRAYSLRVANSRGQSFDAMAAELVDELVDELEVERIEAAATGLEGDARAQRIFEEIRAILVERQVLEF